MEIEKCVFDDFKIQVFDEIKILWKSRFFHEKVKVVPFDYFFAQIIN